MAYIKIDEASRITAASYTHHCGDGEIEVKIPDEIRMENIHAYLFVNGKFVHNPISASKVETPSQLDRLEAQITYTAMMTDTLLEE